MSERTVRPQLRCALCGKNYPTRDFREELRDPADNWEEHRSRDGAGLTYVYSRPVSGCIGCHYWLADNEGNLVLRPGVTMDKLPHEGDGIDWLDRSWYDPATQDYAKRVREGLGKAFEDVGVMEYEEWLSKRGQEEKAAAPRP